MKEILILDIQQLILIYSYKSQLSHKHLGILSDIHTCIYVNGTLPTVSIKTALKKTTFSWNFWVKNSSDTSEWLCDFLLIFWIARRYRNWGYQITDVEYKYLNSAPECQNNQIIHLNNIIIYLRSQKQPQKLKFVWQCCTQTQSRLK